MRENSYQRHIRHRLEETFPGCVVLKNDSYLLPGVPDLLVLYKDRWAMLEVKTRRDAPQEPNQDYYVEVFNGMSFASFIYPENEEAVFDALQRSFQTQGAPRLPQS